MRLLSFYIALLLIFVCDLSGYAQSDKPVNVSIKVMRNKEDVSGCKIYLFRTRKDAQDFHDAQVRNAASEVGGVVGEDYSRRSINYNDLSKTDPNGFCQIVALTKWYIVAYREDELLSNVISIKDYAKGGNALEVELKIEVTSQIKELQNVTKSETWDKEFEPKDVSFPVGDLRKIVIDYPFFPVFGTDATCRYGLLPYATVAGDAYGFTSAHQGTAPKSNAIVKQMVPCVVDGENYAKTQLRKMGYDDRNDSLSKYIDKSQKIQAHSSRPIIFRVRDALQPVEQEAIYPIYGLLWQENYGNLVVLDTVLIGAGYVKNPMRFIDLALPDIDINSSNYYYRARTELIADTKNIPLNFVRGEAQINPADSVGRQALNNIIETLKDIKSNDGNIYAIKIHGYASPEGGKATNESLSRRRSAYLASIISEQVGRLSAETGATVASWKEVADLLRADSIADPENVSRAEQIEQIIASSKSDAQIDARMQASSLYRFLRENEEKYYKPLRKVEITYQYSVRKELSREEVIQRYEDKGAILFPYQYQYLFEYLKDRPAELEQVAKKAMELTEPRKMGKPWTLAAYYLAKCYLSRDTCDVTLLAPYIALSDKECKAERPNSYLMPANPNTWLNAVHRSMDGDTLQYMNDEGVVMQQVSMLIKANKILDAAKLAVNLLPEDDPRYQQPLKVLECMKGRWEEPSVREGVANTSDWNKVVVYAAQSDEATRERFWKEAWSLLNDSTIFRMNTARELYMKATLAYRLYATAKNWNSRIDDKTRVDIRFFDTKDFDIFSHPEFDDDEYPWGAIMVKACEMAPSLINTLKFDGEFNQNYRDGFAAYWNIIHPDNILK